VKVAFIDTAYLVALLDPRDALNARGLRVAKRLAADHALVVTSDLVLVELANYFSRGPLRSHAIEWIGAIRGNPGWEVAPVDRALLGRVEARYRDHADKTWSLTDCSSMEIMRARGIADIATSDAGFAQAGFRILLR
jgi:predicted nucleic acid-binding protein